MLDNGLEVILQRDMSRPRISMVVTYRVGAGHDPEGYRGMAHLATHMSYRGSRHIKGRGALELLEAVGAFSVCGKTTPWMTYYTAEIPSSELPLLLWIESDRMAFVIDQLSEESLDLEKKIVSNELGLGKYWNLAREIVEKAAYPEGHVYHRAFGSESDIEDINIEHLQWFYQTYYRPDNATLAIVGSFEPGQTKRLVEQYFGPIRPPKNPIPDTTVPAVIYRGKKSLEVHAQFNRERLRLTWNIPCNAGLCYTKVKLLRTLVEHFLQNGVLTLKKVASHIDVRLTRMQQHTRFLIDVSLVLDRDLNDVQRMVMDELSKLHQTGIGEKEFSRAIKETEVYEIVTWQDPMCRGVLFTQMRPYDQPHILPYVFQIIEELNGISTIAMQDAIHKWMPLDRLLEVRLVRDEEAPKPYVKNVQGDLRFEIKGGTP